MLPRGRQRANLRYQEEKNLRNWGQSNLYRALPADEGAIFLHIPKTAGTAVAGSLLAKAGFHWLDPTQPPASNRLLVPHFHLDWLITNGILSKDFVESVPVMSVVRHPAARALSAYEYLKKIGHLPEAWTLTRFLAYLRLEDPRIGGAQVSRLAHAAPQHRWLDHTVCRPSITIFRQERLISVRKWTRANFGQEVLIESASNNADRQIEHLNSRDRMLIGQLYRRDFDLLKYSLTSPGFEGNSLKHDLP